MSPSDKSTKWESGCCRIDVTLLLCIAQVQFFNEDIILCVSTRAEFHAGWTAGVSGSNVCIVPSFYNSTRTYRTLQRKHRKGAAAIELCYGCLLFSFFPRAPGVWKASRTPGCDFIKVWNERSVTRRSRTWHPAAGPFFCCLRPQSTALMTPLWKSVSLIPLRDPSTALSASDTNLIPDRSVRWKPRLSGLLINVAALSVYRSVYLKFMARVRTDGIVQRWLIFPPLFFWLKCEF